MIKNGPTQRSIEVEKQSVQSFDFADKYVLEVGAGNGRTTLIYAKKAKRVDAIDTDENMIKSLMRGVNEMGLDSKISVKNVSFFAVNNQRYDVVLFSFSLHEMPVKRAIRKAFQLTDTVFVFDHDRGSEWTWISGENKRIDKEWDILSEFHITQDKHIEVIYYFESIDALSQYVRECRGAEQRIKKYEKTGSINISSPHRMVEIRSM